MALLKSVWWICATVTVVYSSALNNETVESGTVKPVKPGTVNVTSESGATVILPCVFPSGGENIQAVLWKRSDMQLFTFMIVKDEQSFTDGQDKSFVERADMVDRQMVDGIASLRLTNAMSTDNGEYVCTIHNKETSKWETTNTVNLAGE